MASRFTREDEADEAIQTAYARKKTGRMKTMSMVVMLVLGFVLGILTPFLALEGSFEPFYFPIWPLLIFVLTFILIGLAVGIFFNFRIVGHSYDEFERNQLIDRSSRRSLAILAVATAFLVIFLSFMPWTSSLSWVEGVMKDQYGTYERDVTGWGMSDLMFTPNDPLEVVSSSVKVEVLGNGTVDVFIGKFEDFQSINESDAENKTMVEGRSLTGGFKYNTDSFEYDGTEFEAGQEYIIRVFNEDIDDKRIKITVERHVSDFLVWSMIGICIGYIAVASLSYGLMVSRRKMKVRTPAKEPARAAGPRGAADMFRGMEDEVEAMFGPRERGFREGGVPSSGARARAAGAGAGRRRQEGAGRPARERAPERRAVDRPETAPPGPPEGRRAREVPERRGGREDRKAASDMERPVGVKKTIACPRCKTRFTYTKVEGRVTEIECPNCGKRGRVGAKKRRTEPERRARPEKEKPKKEVPEKKPSPLEELTGIGAGEEKKETVKKKTLACPKCKKRFQVEEKTRPFKIECPHCGKTGMLK